MREVVLDANVIVAWLDDADVLAPRARELMQRLRDEGAELVLVDIAVTEALSVLCRRAKQRRNSPPDLATAVATVRGWAEHGAIRWLAREHERLMPDVLAIVESAAGTLNFNDAMPVTLQRSWFEPSIPSLFKFAAGAPRAPRSLRVMQPWSGSRSPCAPWLP